MKSGPYQFRITHLIVATVVSAALLSWWRLYGFAWVGPLLLGLSTFLGCVALLDAVPQQPLKVAKFFGSAVGIQMLVLMMSPAFLALPLYIPVFQSCSAFFPEPIDFRRPTGLVVLQTMIGVLCYALIATGAWAWWHGYANSEV